MNDEKVLVAYFSPHGSTKEAAVKIADAVEGDLYEILPENPYTEKDLDYKDKNSRTSVEMNDPNCRPALGGAPLNLNQYDVIYLGFPIWWGREPSVIDSFLDAYDWKGKFILPFYTSGGMSSQRTAERLQNLVGREARVMEGRRVGGEVSEDDLKIWFDEISANDDTAGEAGADASIL
ncbi:MAG: flavodoxin [Lachnospiraceae bacterium]|jgi:flavodoxin|nr:flavodoxin [Lachnospiraceae bacterium]MCH4030823.1 flavodoxin [Lachnospiraceae bacterium]MCH4070795.1 flavodoxin [Lachnospiraceae bacterium]MCH4107029.1 flavodoxin [Lachnospiraceae bacterium]MCI1302115.1 flavodoxin [Lachnospiraceae bacterium]